MGIIDFKDKIGGNTANGTSNLFVQTVEIGPLEATNFNLNMQGMFYNPNDASVTFTLHSVNGVLKTTLQPKQYFSVPYIYIYRLVNLSNYKLIFYYSNSGTGAFSTNEQLSILGSVNISNSSINMSGSVELTNDSINVLGSVNIQNDINANILNSSIDANIINSSIDANILNSSIDANILNSSIDANILNSSINVLGSVSVLGSVNITNSSIDANILNSSINANILNSSIDANILNSSIDANILNASINMTGSITNRIETDMGTFTSTTQETQASGTNTYTYNPWGFSTSSSPAVRGNYGVGEMINVQQSGARGYLTFYFYVYNSTSSSGSATVNAYFYDKLPSNPASNEIYKLSFSSGTIDSGSGVWVTVHPNLYWDYNSLVVFCYGTGTTGNAIRIALPSSANYINSHYWNGSYWDSSDNGLIGYWQITNTTSPNSLPVTVEGGNITVSRTLRTPNVFSTSSSNGHYVGSPVPSGKVWKIKSVLLTYTASDSATYYYILSIYPTSMGSAGSWKYAIDDVSASVTSGDEYAYLWTTLGSGNRAPTNAISTNISAGWYGGFQQVFSPFELYPNETIYIQSDEGSNSTTYTIQYTEESI
jgi:hypothetical protein